MKHISNSTPKTLDEAILNAVTIGPLNELQERTYHVIKDFMSQKFSVAMLRSDEKTAIEFDKLFKELTKRNVK